MSAFVEPLRLFQWTCAECGQSGPLTTSEDDADAQADAHDNAEHNPFDRSDDA